MRANSESGQFTVEMVLLLVIILGLAVTVSTMARNSRIMATLVEGPWPSLQGMIEDGVWMNAKDSKAYHPTHIKRHRTPQGDPP